MIPRPPMAGWCLASLRRSPSLRQSSSASAPALGSPPPGPLRPVVDRESGSGLDAVYRLRLALPQVDSSVLSLGRVDDDLIIGASGRGRVDELAHVIFTDVGEALVLFGKAERFADGHVWIGHPARTGLEGDAS